MGSIDPRDLVTAAKTDEIMSTGERQRFDTGGSKGVTLPATGLKDSLGDVETFRSFYDPATGAVVYLPEGDNGE